MEETRCRCCGREAEKKETAFLLLSDGSMICGECTLRVRILYPRSFTWVNVYYTGDTDDDYDSDEDTRWIDPLSDISFEEFQSALERADEERSARRARFGDSRAYFSVDDISRVIKYSGKGRKLATDEYAVTGTVLLGTVGNTGVIRVARREKALTKDIKRVETPHDNSSATDKASYIPEGCYGGLILDGDGKGSSTDAAKAVYDGVYPALHERGIYLAA